MKNCEVAAGRSSACRVTVRDPQEMRTLVGFGRGRMGRIDMLFNVAGIMQVGPLDEIDCATDFREAMETNAGTAEHGAGRAPAMRKRGWGRIVNVASIGGKRAVPHMLPYDTSKFALVGLSNGLRTELMKDGILITTACPSLMRTAVRGCNFKGRHREENAWFSIGGSLPLTP